MYSNTEELIPVKKFSLEEPQLLIELAHSDADIPYELLLMADPSRELIEKYIATGKCYLAYLRSEIVGVLVLNEVSSDCIEIKNIAISLLHQGLGFGKQLLRFAEENCHHLGYSKLIIGTGNSSIGQLGLYQKEGFEIERVVKNFFVDNYDEPIFENGIQCKHLIFLEKNLSN